MTDASSRRRYPATRRDVEPGALVGYEGASQHVFAEPFPSARADEEGSMEVLRRLWRRRWLVTLCTLAGSVLIAAIVMSLPSYYVAEARVLVGLQAPRLLNNVESILTDVSPDAERVQNEGFVVQSRTIAAQVIEELRLADNPSFNPDLQPPSLWSRFSLANLAGDPPDWLPEWLKTNWPKSAPAAPPTETQRENRLIDLLLSRIDVSTLGRSHVLSIKADAMDATTAAAIANAFADKYVDFQRNEKIKTMNRVDRFLMERVGELREQVRKSDQAVEDYRRTYGLYKSGTGSVTAQQLAELNTQLMLAQTAKVEAESRLREAQALGGNALSSESVPEVLHSGLITALKQQQADTERRASEAAAAYGERHPQMQTVRAEARAIAARLSAEVARIVEGLARDARAADARHAALVQNFERLKAQMGAVNDKTIQLEALERDSLVNRNLLEAMLNRAKQTMGSADVLQSNGKLISPAAAPETPTFPPKPLLLAIGVLVSFLGGAGVALGLEAGDRTFRRPEQIEELTGVPVLAMVPQVRSRTATTQVLRDPISPYSEALRRLFVGIELTEAAMSPKLLLFSSATPAEGKSVMVASLGRLLASNGKRVLVIDCDWRRPKLHQLFRCSNSKGLSDLLSDEQAVLNDCVHRDDASGVDVMPAGFWDPRSAHLMSSDRMAELLRLLSSAYDVILLDSPPVLVTADALVLSRLVEKVVFLVRWGHTRQDVVMEGLKQLLDAQADVAGIAVSRVVVNEYRRHSHRDFSYGRPPVPTLR
jgi:succinoglycan biosynthesis transport protein ExoP